MTVLEAIGDIQAQARSLRASHPQVAAALTADALVLLSGVPAQPVKRVAELFGVSRETAYDWIKRRYLTTVEGRGGRVLVAPESVAALLPVIKEWRDSGRSVRPGAKIRQWLQDEAELRAEAATAASPHREDRTTWLKSRIQAQRSAEPGRSAASPRRRAPSTASPGSAHQSTIGG